ncbi:MAG: translation initiation factor IF-3 [Myxococcota bacterium]
MPEHEQIDARLNAQITADRVRLVDRDGDQLGVMSLDDALAAASDHQLELVEVEAAVSPPVCRLMSKDEIARRYQPGSEASAQTHATVLREIRLEQPDALDAELLEDARAYLLDGDELKITLRDIGRAAASQEAASAVLREIAERLDDIAIVEVPAERAGRDMVLFLAPR